MALYNRVLATNWMLCVEQLGFDHEEHRLFEDVNFVLTSGQSLRISGGNGSGKTTLLRILARLLPPTSGRVCWQQEQTVVAASPPISYLGHQHGLQPDLTALENLQRLCVLLGQPMLAQSALEAMLTDWALYDQRHQIIRTLSFGQQKRLSLCQLAIHESVVWILDEPWTGLDATSAAKVSALIDAHVAQRGMVIVTTHHLLNEHDAWHHVTLS